MHARRPEASAPTTASAAATADLDLGLLLRLDDLGDGLFVGAARSGPSARTFGGEVAGRAVVAAGRTVPAGRRLHSVHCRFLTAADTARPTTFRVTPLRDGGTYSVCRVTAHQDDALLLELTASFARPRGESMSHALAGLEDPPPQECPDPAEAFAGDAETCEWLDWLLDRKPMRMRFPHTPALTRVHADGEAPARSRTWIATLGTLEDELERAAGLVYLSDILLLSAPLGPHGRTIRDPGLAFASLDHTVWLHDVADPTDWVLYDMEGLWTGADRGLTRGTILAPDGRLLATTMQEGMLRVR